MQSMHSEANLGASGLKNAFVPQRMFISSGV